MGHMDSNEDEPSVDVPAQELRGENVLGNASNSNGLKAPVHDSPALAEAEESPLSKNQQKKLKRKREWEEGRDARKAKRREKVKQKKQRSRDAHAEERAQPAADASSAKSHARGPGPRHRRQLPVAIVLDCQFDDLMLDHERTSLGGQLTRCYSENKKAPFGAHLIVASFGGQLQARFDGLLKGVHRAWTHATFTQQDFTEAAKMAAATMRGPSGGAVAGALGPGGAADASEGECEDEGEGEVVYLTSDSPTTLTELRPFSTYIVGGLVDKNRHKGICYQRAVAAGVKTAKLPIGEYMTMQSRQVLATNHVVEIMLHWLELGDWGRAFEKCIPKRKGGVLRGAAAHDGLAPDCKEETLDDEEETPDEEGGVLVGEEDMPADERGMPDDEGDIPDDERDTPEKEQQEEDCENVSDERKTSADIDALTSDTQELNGAAPG